MSAPKTVIRRGDAGLFIIAGLPKAIFNETLTELGKIFPAVRFIGVPSPTHGTKLYSESTRRELVQATGSFIVRKRTENLKALAPSRIFLIYARGVDEEQLLSDFDFFVFPVPVVPDDDVPPNLQGENLLWRRDASEALRLFSSAVRSAYGYTNEETLYLKNEITEKRGNSPLTLPPMNFMCGKNQRIAERFREARSRRLAWKWFSKNILQKKYLRHQVPKMIRGSKDWFFSDERKIIFPPALPGAQHALVREVDEDCALRSLVLVLNQLYRFGFPLEDGFHHDAQNEDPSDLKNEIFWCSQLEHAVRVHAPSINVHANDVLRGSGIVHV